MPEFVDEHWRLLISVAIVMCAGGFILAIVGREYARKWILSNGSIKVMGPIELKHGTPLSKEDHDKGCDDRWEQAALLAAKDRELVMVEINHLKESQDRAHTKLDKIFDRLDKWSNGP